LDHKVASEQLWYPPKFKLVSSVFEGSDLIENLLQSYNYFFEWVSLSFLWMSLDVSDEDYSRALAQINCNAFHWEGKFILTYRCSFINHSCWPNASLVFTNESLIKVFTIQFVPKGNVFRQLLWFLMMIPFDWNKIFLNLLIDLFVCLFGFLEGEEICICYKTQLLYMPTLLRQEKLKAIYEFDCACCRCVPSQVSPNPHDHLMTKVYHVPEDSIQVQKAISFMENFYENLNVKYQSKEFILWQFSDLRRRLLEEFLQRPFGLEFSATKLDLSHWRMNFIRRELISLYLYVIHTHTYFLSLSLSL
jgi:hypothetical protein